MNVKDRLIILTLKSLSICFPQRKAVKHETGLGMLLCHSDVTMAVYCIQSLFFNLGYTLPLYIINDGSLTKNDKRKLANFFTVAIDDIPDALIKIKKKYSSYPLLFKYLSDKNNHVKKMKLAVLLLAPFNKVICLDPDILFYKKPKEIKSFLEGEKNYFSTFRHEVYEKFVRENWMELHFRKLLYLHLRLESNYLFNSGLMLFNSNTINKQLMDRLERVLKIFHMIDYARMYYSEEALIANMFEPKKCVLLSDIDYLNYFSPVDDSKEFPTNATSIHFIAPAKPLFMREAIKYAVKNHLFRS